MKEKLENILGVGTIAHSLNLIETASVSFHVCMSGGLQFTTFHPLSVLSDVQLTSPLQLACLPCSRAAIRLFLSKDTVEHVTFKCTSDSCHLQRRVHLLLCCFGFYGS